MKQAASIIFMRPGSVAAKVFLEFKERKEKELGFPITTPQAVHLLLKQAGEIKEPKS